MKSILVVDDEEFVRKTLAAVLSRAGYHVVVATDGEDAFAKLRAGYLPDLIFLDLRMPKMDGKAFLEEIKKYRPLSEIPVVVTSALELDDPPAWIARLDKPFDLDEVLTTVRMYAR